MNIIFEKGEVPNDFWKVLIKPLYKKGDKSDCRNHRGISLVSVGCKLLSSMILCNDENVIDENEKVCDTLNVKKDLFSEEELATVLKGLKNNKAPGVDSMINEFLKYGGSEVRNKLLKIMNMIFEKGKYPIILGKP